MLQIPIRTLLADAARAGEREPEVLRAAMDAIELRLADLTLVDAAPPPPRALERTDSVLEANTLRGFYAYAVSGLEVLSMGPEGRPRETYVCVKFGIVTKESRLAKRIIEEARTIDRKSVV